MSPSSVRRTTAHKAKQNASRRKAKRVVTRPSPILESAPEAKVSSKLESPQALPALQQMQLEVLQSEQLIMQRLVWPPTEPPLVIDAPPGMTGLASDFLSIRQLSIQNRVYDVKSIAGNEPVQLRLRQNYWITPLEDAPHGELALVREQAQPDQTEQFVVVSEPTQRRVWIDKADVAKDSLHVHIIGAEREWATHDFSLAHLDMSEPRIIGIIEAILVPVPEVFSSQVATEPVLPEPQIIKLANGKSRRMYRDFDGQFISKAKYEALKSKASQPPKPRKHVVSLSIPSSSIEAILTYPNQLEMIAPDQLRITVSLPSLIPVREFLNDIPRRLEAIDALYLLCSLIAVGETEVVREVIRELTEDRNGLAVIKSVLQKYELNQIVKPLQLIRSHYGSDAVNDLLGFGKILEIIVSLPERIRKGRLEEEVLKRDIEAKDEENRAKKIGTAREILALIREGRELGLTDKEIGQLYERLESTATPLIDSSPHGQHRIFASLSRKDTTSEPKALAAPKSKSTNRKKKTKRQKR